MAAAGVDLVFTALALRWRDLAPAPSLARERGKAVRRDRLVQAGLAGIPGRDLAAVIVALVMVGALAGYAVFGGIVPALAIGGFAGSFPVASYRMRRAARRSAAMDAWPRMLEELRILTSSVGRSVPQALFEVGRRAPDVMRGAFDEAHREWLLSTDFARTIGVLKAALADPTADAACETLLVANEVGGTDLDRSEEHTS